MALSKIDIVTTAVLRPKLFERTLESFCKRMLTDRERYRLILNIDCIGEKVKPDTMIRIAENYFDDIIYNISHKPWFPSAVIWCWKTTTAPKIFHMEEDWKLLVPIKIDDMIAILDKHPKLASLRLNKQKTGKVTKQDRLQGFKLHHKVSLNPTLFTGKFIRTTVPFMSKKRNPEKQLRPNNLMIRKHLRQFQHGIYIRPTTERIVVDTGRKWMKKTPYIKPIGFLQWTKK